MTENTTLVPQKVSKDETSLGYMLKLAAPMIVTYVSFTVMQFVDRFMVSYLGTEALAAILPAGIISFIPASFALGVITTVSTFISQSLGRGRKKDCSNYCWQVIYMGLAYFLVSVAIMWPAAPWIFRTLGHEPAVANLEVIYLRIMLYCHVLAIFIWSSSQFFMGVHRPIIKMYAAVCGHLTNVGVNYLLIFGKFGFPKMGIAGAGWGTFIGITLEAGILMGVFLSGETNATFKSRQTTKIDLSKMVNLVKIGFPAGVAFMINVTFLGTILFGLVGRFGKEALAATSAVFSCINVSVMAIVGIGAALTAAVGKSIGEGRKDVAVRQTSVCLRAGMAYMLFMGFCFIVFRKELMAFWSSDDKVISTGINIVIFAVLFQVFDAMTIIYNGALRGAGDTLWLGAISASGSLFILGVGGFLMIKFFPQLGAIGPWIAATANMAAVGLANRWRFKSKRWMKIDLFKRPAVAAPVEIEEVVE